MICPQIDLACHETVFVKRRNIFQIFSLCLPLCVWPNFVHSLHCTANSKVNFARLLLATLHSQQQQWQQQLPSLTRVRLKRVLSSLDKDAIIWDSTVIYPPDQNVFFKVKFVMFCLAAVSKLFLEDLLCLFSHRNQVFHNHLCIDSSWVCQYEMSWIKITPGIRFYRLTREKRVTI